MPVNFTGSYTQDFDTLATTGTNNTWANDTTLLGWSLFRQPALGTAITTYNADNGGSPTGNFYSYGTSGTSDRALGGLGAGGAYFGSPASGAVAGWIAFSATNTTGATINSLNVAFDGEQWRNGGNPTAQTMTLQYGFGSSFTTVSTWNTPGGNFNWTSPERTATAAAVNGNGVGRVANVGGTLSSLNWGNNSTLWFRWVETNDVGNDHGLAIDNFSINALVATPTVTIAAQDAAAAEAGQDPGTFRITRTGDTTNALTVNYTISGTATNGTDYSNLGGTATIAAGQSFVDVTITPIDDVILEGSESVTLTLSSSANYTLGATTTATVAIADNDATVSSLTLIGSGTLADTAVPNEFRDLSGITYNAANNTYLLVSDVESNPRFYTVQIAIDAAGSTVTPTHLNGTETPTALTISGGFPNPDMEGIALDNSGNIFVSSEGFYTGGSTLQPDNYVISQNPFIKRFTTTGTELLTLTLPSRFTTSNTTLGPRNNGALESLTLTPSNNYLFTAVEAPLKQDQGLSFLPFPFGSNAPALNRIVRFDLSGGVSSNPPSQEFLYIDDSGYGLSELLAIDNSGQRLLSIERAANTSGTITGIKIFEVSLAGATDISSNNGLGGNTTGITSASKSLLADFSTPALSSLLANYEGVTFGAPLPDGRRSLVLVSDNNGTSANRFTAFAINETTNMVTIAAQDAAAAEAGQDPGTFRITRTGDTTNALTVNYTVSGTATNGTDYNNLGGTATIAAGQSFVDVTITPVDDTTVEGNETITLTLTDTAAYDLGATSSATVAIADNDVATPLIPPVINNFDNSNAVTGWQTFSVDSDQVNTWNVSTSFSNAEANGFGDTAPANDWLISPAINLNTTTGEVVSFSTWNSFTDSGIPFPQVKFLYSTNYTGSGNPNAATWTELSFTPSPQNSSTWTPSGNIDISGISGTNVYFAFQYQSSGTTTGSAARWRVDSFNLSLLNTVSIAATDAAAAEAGQDPATFRISRTGDTTNALTVNYTVSGTATNGTDYNNLGGTATIAAGQSFIDVTVTPVDDTAIESDETVTLTLSSNANYILGATTSGTVTITNNDFPIVNIAAGTAPLEGVTTGTYTITLNSPAPVGGLTVNYSLGGTATNGTDYSLAAVANITALTSGSFTIAAGQTSATLQLNAVNDGTVDPNETVQLTLTSGTGYTLAGDTTPFVAAPNVSGTANPASVAIGDFNGDGRVDLAIANNGSTTVSIRLGDGTGNFSGSTTVSVGSQPGSIAIGDFNGDGRADLAVANYGSNTVSIRLGDGAGNFGGSTNLPVGTNPTSVAIGDFNGDGRADFAVANVNSNTVSIRLGDGTGNFSGSTDVPVGSIPQSIAIGDFNGDGRVDIAAGNSGSNTVSIRLGDGAGNFSSTNDVSVGFGPQSVAIGDFNGDGRADLTTADFYAGTVSIRLGDGTGNFSGSTDVPVGINPFSVAIRDFNGDGNTDFAVTNFGSGTVSIRLGDGTGNFSSTNDVSVGTNPVSVAIGDFNSDGKADLATANFNSNNVSILLNNFPSATLTIAELPTVSLSVTDANVGETGGNTGTFRISRTGDTTSALTITYTIGGTATNGTDYSNLGSSATIAAGQSFIDVTVTPIEDQTIEGPETVTLTLNSSANYTLGAATATVTIAEKSSTVDFNKDGNTDIFWRNVSSGDVAIWALNGVNLSYAQIIDKVPVSSGWEPIGVGDFTGEGNSDVLWRNRYSGENVLWEMNGTTIANSYAINPVIPVESGWEVVAVGDFTNDGKADIFWRNVNTGDNSFWEMNGASFVRGVVLPFEDANNSWGVVGVGDFTSDGNTDILWRNMQTGQNRYWEMNGANLIQEHYIDPMPVEYGWNVAAVGDFSKDGKADILWHNNGGGQLVTWEMSNGVMIGAQQLFPDTPPSTGWTIV